MVFGKNSNMGCVSQPEYTSSESRNSFSTQSYSDSRSHSTSTTRKQKKKRRHDMLVKAILLGESSVGKTCLTTRFAEDEFHVDTLSTIGMDIRYKNMPVDGKLVRVQLWDTAGQEKYRSIAKAYFRGADAIIFVFDITCRESFFRLEMWLNDLRKSTYQVSDLPLIILGNKLDMEGKRVISYEEAKEYSDRLDIPYYETSARTGFGVTEAFNSIVNRAVVYKGKKIQKESVELSSEKKKTCPGRCTIS